MRSALGNRIAGIMGNDHGSIAALIAAGKQGGERLWELPLVRDYLVDLESDVADLANVAAAGYGGAIHAGLFLQEFVGGVPWAHMDIAGVGFTDRDSAQCAARGVGFGVRLLARYAPRPAADKATSAALLGRLACRAPERCGVAPLRRRLLRRRLAAGPFSTAGRSTGNRRWVGCAAATRRSIDEYRSYATRRSQRSGSVGPAGDPSAARVFPTGSRRRMRGPRARESLGSASSSLAQRLRALLEDTCDYST